jgi:hypothetical protein
MIFILYYCEFYPLRNKLMEIIKLKNNIYVIKIF